VDRRREGASRIVGCRRRGERGLLLGARPRGRAFEAARRRGTPGPSLLDSRRPCGHLVAARPPPAEKEGCGALPVGPDRCGFPRDWHVSSWTPRELVHPVVAVDLAGRVLIVNPTEQSAPVHRGGAAPGERRDVVDLEAERGTADPAGIERELALALVPRPDGPFHRGGDVAGVPCGARVPLRTLDLGAAFRLRREQQVERGLQHLLRRRARLRVPLSLPCGFELVEELLRHRHVKAAQLRGQRLERVPLVRRCDNRRRSSHQELGRRLFNRGPDRIHR
jgi:hypothetical protein